MEAILVKSNRTVNKIAREAVNMSAGFLKFPSFFKDGTCFILLNIPNKRDAENILANTPENVATIAMAMVIHKPHSPKTGSAAAAKA